MSFLIDFFPWLVFFGAFKMADIFVATGFLIAASAVQLIIYRVRDKEFEKSKVWLFLAIVIFGGITIILHDDFYLKWKVTLVLSGFAIAFFGSRFVGKKQPLVKKFFMHITDGLEIVPDSIWNKINSIWIVTYILQALTNHYFAFYQSQNIWVNFKVWGLMGSNLVIIIISLSFLFPYLEEAEAEKEKNEAKLPANDSPSKGE